jgi:GT2 family glycosyltransferase
MVTTSIITPVWNRADLTGALLYHLWKLYEHRAEVEFVVVDNGSRDGTPAFLAAQRRSMHGRLVVVRNEENCGFGPANNQGARAARGEALIFLSNDVIPRGDFVTPLVALFARKPRALAGAQLLDFDTGWNRFDGNVIPYLAGWCLACTRATWETLGGFDERYTPCDYEDMDLSQAAQRQGVELVALDLPLQHAFGQSAARLPGGREMHTVRNRDRFVAKWGLYAQ